MARTTVSAAIRLDTAGGALVRGLLGGAAALIGSAGLVLAQGVERHPAPLLQGAQTTTISTAALESRLTDPTPFGVDLSGLMVIDAHANGTGARAKAGPGLDTRLAGPTAQAPALRAILQKYIGQPLSYQLIGAIEVDVTKFYRDNGRSLVLVTVPPQEITSGVLQVNVNTFVLEGTAVQGAAPAAQGYVASQIRVRPGQEVDTDQLLADVNWLNLNPFRHVSVEFEPGRAKDSTKLTLQVQNTRPWSAYAGISNGGSEDTGILRAFGGFNMSALPWQDHQLSYQGNAAPASLAHGDLWDTGTTKGYLSHSLSYFVPLTLGDRFRMKATFGVSHISSYSEPGGAFSTSTTTDGATAELAFPLPRGGKGGGTWKLLPEVYLGLAYNAYDRDQLFGGAVFDTERTKLQHVQLGLRSTLNGKLFGKPSRGDFDLSITGGRQETEGEAKVTYSFAKLSVAQEIMFDKDHSLKVRLAGQYSPDILHPLEQLTLGGDGTVRAYPTSTAASQSAATLSFEYRTAPVSIPVGRVTGQLRPHLFADFGVADANGVADAEHMASIGVGGEMTIGNDFVAKVDIGSALTDAGTTDAGTPSIAVSLTARF